MVMMMNNWNYNRTGNDDDDDDVHKETVYATSDGFLGLLCLIAIVCFVLLNIRPRRRPSVPGVTVISRIGNAQLCLSVGQVTSSQISVTAFVDCGSRIICLELNHLSGVVPG